MNKKIVISIIFIIVAIVASVFMLQKKSTVLVEKKQSQAQQQSEQQSTQSGSQQVIDTSDWKTYRDEKYKFEIKYNPNWEIKENPGKGALGDESSYIILNKNLTNLAISIQKINSDKDPETWYKEKGFGGTTLEKVTYTNGYKTYYVKEDNENVHLLHEYLISNNKEIIWFTFNEKQRTFNKQTGKNEEISFSEYLSEFETMVNSIRFLK